MTLANCKLYLEQAEDEVTKKFWSERIARKYPTPEKKEVKVKKVKEVKE